MRFYLYSAFYTGLKVRLALRSRDPETEPQEGAVAEKKYFFKEKTSSRTRLKRKNLSAKNQLSKGGEEEANRKERMKDSERNHSLILRGRLRISRSAVTD